MPAYTSELQLSTEREGQIVDLTNDVAKRIDESGIADGMALVFTISSTSAITIIEHEPGLLQDIPDALDRLIPAHGEGVQYGHEERWRDGNGHSHVRASIMKPDLTVPVKDGAPVLGTWQSIVFVELDVKPRDRRVAVHVVGE